MAMSLLDITIDEALEIILASANQLPADEVPITNCVGRICAEDVFSPRDMPPFSSSAVDGYGVIADDIKGADQSDPVELEVIGELTAGDEPSLKVNKTQAVSIMTGAPIPDGVDAVVMVEDTRLNGNRVQIFKAVEVGRNIRYAGEDLEKGYPIIRKGEIITPPHAGIFASINKSRVRVSRKPSIAILATGDELRDVGETLKPGQIYNANNYTLINQAKYYGLEAVDLGIAPDKKDALQDKIMQGIKQDILLTTGGISMGKYDLVKEVLAELGYQERFWRIMQKPGKPMSFGFLHGTPVFALPGFPVSCMICFEMYVKPLIYKMMGAKPKTELKLWATLAEDIQKKTERTEINRGRLWYEDGILKVKRAGPHGSGVLRTLASANCYFIMPAQESLWKKGLKVQVSLLWHPLTQITSEEENNV